MAQLLLFILLLPEFALSSPKYTLSDLEVLAREGGHNEFLAHALDIRPSERQQSWKIMVAKMVDSYTKGILSKSEISLHEYQTIQELRNWPALKTDDVFMARRQEIGLRYLGQCLKKSSPCWEEVSKFWDSDNTNPETAYKLAHLTSQYKDSPLPIWKFLEVALKSSLSVFYCNKEFAMKALWGKLEMDYIRMGPKGNLLKKIDSTIHPECLVALNKEAHKRLMIPQRPGDRELAHQILLVQSKADLKTSDFFHTVYLLENPSQGELFNYSWNRLKELGNSFNRREAVLAKLKKLDPLPDEIVSSYDKAKKRVILTHFKQNFPEYLDHYSDQCVLFYGGKSSFPQGNPTVHCQQLMNSEMAPQVFDLNKIKQYRDVKKI